jgi:hypothetical protein
MLVQNLYIWAWFANPLFCKLSGWAYSGSYEVPKCNKQVCDLNKSSVVYLFYVYGLDRTIDNKINKPLIEYHTHCWAKRTDDVGSNHILCKHKHSKQIPNFVGKMGELWVPSRKYQNIINLIVNKMKNQHSAVYIFNVYELDRTMDINLI